MLLFIHIRLNIDAYFVSQFCPLSNSIWSEKLSYVYLPRMELPKTEYKVYTTSDLNNDILFKQAEKSYYYMENMNSIKGESDGKGSNRKMD